MLDYRSVSIKGLNLVVAPYQPCLAILGGHGGISLDLQKVWAERKSLLVSYTPQNERMSPKKGTNFQ